MTTATATTHLRVPYEGDTAKAGELEDALQHPAGTCARCDDGSPEDRYYGLAQVNRRLGTEVERLRELLDVWLTGDCPMYDDRCRREYLCRHCFENAVIDFDLEAIPVTTEGER